MNPKLVITAIVLFFVLILLLVFKGRDAQTDVEKLTPTTVDYVCLNPDCEATQQVDNLEATKSLASTEMKMNEKGQVVFRCPSCKQFSQRLKDEIETEPEPQP